MNKKDQEAFNSWKKTSLQSSFTHKAWEGACVYKDKRITELEFQLKGFQANYNDTGKLVNGLRKRIAELEKEVNSLRRLRDTILSTRYLVDDGYSYLVNIAKSLKEGGADD